MPRNLCLYLSVILNLGLALNFTELSYADSENDFTRDTAIAITSVSQLSDVQTTDWAFTALQSLSERYGCIAGYPNLTFKGQNTLSRYEFAVGVNACLDKINQLIASGLAEKISKEDIDVLKNLQENFASELETIKSRLSSIETKTSQLEAQQFSPLTKLTGEGIFSIAGLVTGDNANGQAAPRNITLSNRVRLRFDTTFTGKDALRIRLQARNTTALSTATLTNEGRLAYDGQSDFEIDVMRYRFPLSSNTNAYIFTETNGFKGIDFTTYLNPWLDSSGSGAISRFGQRNPLYSYSGGGAGVAFRHQFDRNLGIDLGYIASNGADSTRGLFGGKYQFLGQLVFSSGDQFKLGLVYTNAYSPGRASVLNTGSTLVNTNLSNGLLVNGYGFQGYYNISPSFSLGGWLGYANHRHVGRGDAQVLNWTLTLAFPDLGQEGNLGAILLGMEPKVIGVSSGLDLGKGLGKGDRDTSFHIEAFYRHQFHPNISVTPGLIWLTAPNHDARNADILIGVIRTTFTF